MRLLSGLDGWLTRYLRTFLFYVKGYTYNGNDVKPRDPLGEIIVPHNLATGVELRPPFVRSVVFIFL